LAAALLAEVISHCRDTALSGAPCGTLCLMGACFDCLMEGVANRQACLRPKLDPWGSTSLPGMMVAGDGGGIGRARASALAGRIAAMEMARWLGRITAVHTRMADARGVLPGASADAISHKACHGRRTGGACLTRAWNARLLHGSPPRGWHDTPPRASIAMQQEHADG